MCNIWFSKIIADVFPPWHFDQQTAKTSALMAAYTPADDQLVKG